MIAKIRAIWTRGRQSFTTGCVMGILNWPLQAAYGIGLLGAWRFSVLGDSCIFALQGDIYAYSLDMSRLLHSVTSVYPFLSPFHLLSERNSVLTSSFIISLCLLVCKVTPRLQCLDIALLAWFLPLVINYNLHAGWPYFLCFCQMSVAMCGILWAGYCLKCGQTYRSWVALLLCYAVLASPFEGLWRGCLFVLNKACLCVCLDIFTVTVRHVEAFSSKSEADVYRYEGKSLVKLRRELLQLPSCLQAITMNFSLYFLQKRLARKQTIRLRYYLIRLNSPALLSRLCTTNRTLLQACLLSFPSLRYLLLLYRSNFSFICWRTDCPPLRILLRGVSGPQSSETSRELMLMRAYMQRFEARLGLLWLQERAGGVGRLTRYLTLDILEYM